MGMSLGTLEEVAGGLAWDKGVGVSRNEKYGKEVDIFYRSSE